MLDIKFVRENPEVVKQNIRNKFQDSKLPLVDEVIELDQEKTVRSSRKQKQSKSREKQNFQTDWCTDGTGQEGRGRRGKETGCCIDART